MYIVPRYLALSDTPLTFFAMFTGVTRRTFASVAVNQIETFRSSAALVIHTIVGVNGTMFTLVSFRAFASVNSNRGVCENSVDLGETYD